MSEIIVLSGFARSGKDEAAKVLVEEFGFRQVSYADKLREALYVLNPIVRQDRFVSSSLEIDYRNIRLQNVIDAFGWQGYKDTEYSSEIRRLIQTLGTEVGRNLIGENTWVDATFNGIGEDEKIVISDGRFFNEFDAARERGGFVWRIDRPGVGPANSHASELAALEYKNFSLFLKNDGTLEQWRDLIIREYTSGRYKEW